MTKRLLRKTLIAGAAIIALVLFVRILYWAGVYVEMRTNHTKYQELIGDNLTYERETMDEQLNMALDWFEHRHLFNGDKGRICERISLIYQVQGDEMAYYRYLGYALYYLEQSDDKDYTVNIYLDLANFYINNYSYDSAQRMIESAQKIESFEEIESLQIKSYAYRIQGMLQTLRGEYEEAEKSLNKSLEVVALSDTGYFEDAYVAMAEVWLARVYFETGRRAECGQLIDKYDGNPLLNQEIYRDIMIRDCVIPFEEVKCLFAVSGIYEKYEGVVTHDMQEELVASSSMIEDFIEICEENGYEMHELVLLLRMQNQYPSQSAEVNEKLYATLSRLYNEILERQNIGYSKVIDSQINDSMIEMARDESDAKKEKNREAYSIITILGLLVLLMTGTWIIINNSYDGLTQLLNRKQFDKKLAALRKRKQQYGIVMMDIDNFKKVNDVYGHPIGDEVLQRLGQILAKEETKNVLAYRYGGEEFVLILKKEVLGSARSIAQRIRTTMEHETWDFDPEKVITLSLGIAAGSGDDDVVTMADENLYTSKKNGKNRVTGEIKKVP